MMTYEAATARLFSYMEYAELSPKRLAAMAGLSPRVMLRSRGRWNPTFDTLKKLEAVLPADFDPEQARREYDEAVDRVRRWFQATNLRRYHLVAQGIQYQWIQHVSDPSWAPSWFALRKLLALVPPEFDQPKER